MMVPLRSNQTTKGRLMAGARSLWRANGMKEKHFGKPIIAIANSFTQLVPGHAHLHEIGQYIKIEIESLGYFSAEFNTIAIDDGIAMGHPGMLYSLPSRQLIADSIEYMCNAHMVDALVCIPNCDKIVPGMLMAAMRLNIPTIFVSGGPMEAGRIEDKKYDLVDIMVMAGDQSVPDSVVREVEGIACPTCGCCSGMFTANSMNCLTEAIGLALPGQGTILATHVQRKKLFTDSAKCLVEAIEQYYGHGDESVLPRSIASREAFMNAMTLDIAMGGSTNTVLHLLAAAQSAGVNFTLNDINMLSRKVPCICKVSPNSRYHLEDVNRAGGVMGILAELDRGGLIDTSVPRIDAASLKDALDQYGISSKTLSSDAVAKYTAAPGGYRNFVLGSQDNHFKQLDQDREEGCIRSVNNAYYKDGGLAVLFGNVAENGCIVKTAGVLDSLFEFNGTAKVFDSEDTACKALLEGKISSGNIVIIRYEGPKGGPGMQEMLYPTSYIKSMHLETSCALITDGRFSGGSSGLSIGHVSPEAAAGGAIGLIMDNDRIEINIHDRKIHLCISDEELSDRRRIENSKGHNAFKPNRKRHVSEPLLAYAWFAGSADKGAIRVIPKAENAFYSAKVNSTTNPSA